MSVRMLSLVCTLLATAPVAGEPLLITNGRIVDLAGAEVRSDQALLIEQGRIQWVGPVDQQPDAESANVVDVGGGYLLPGLIDAHVHLNDPLELSLYLAAGITTVVELGGPDHRRWRDPQAPGPRLLTCGPTVTAGSVEAARAVVARHQASGFDCIKIYDDMPADIFAALTAAARELGLPSMAHIPRNLTWSDMLAAAPGAVAHAEEFLYSPCCSEADFERIVKTMREQDIALITTLVTYDNITRQAHDLDLFLASQPHRYYPPVDFRAWQRPLNRYGQFDPGSVPKLRSLFRFQQWLVNHLHEHGVRIVLGTDAGNTGTFPGISVDQELRWLVASGLTPAAALVSATSASADLLGREDLGRLAQGAQADLLVLAGNPLNDISNVRFVRGVVAQGRWYDGERLRSMREETAAAFAPERAFVDRLAADGVDAALQWLAADPQRRLRLSALNELGYQKLKLEDDPSAALALFKANARLHPQAWIAHASLAEGLLANDQREAALSAAKKALELAPPDSLAREELMSLGLVD